MGFCSLSFVFFSELYCRQGFDLAGEYANGLIEAGKLKDLAIMLAQPAGQQALLLALGADQHGNQQANARAVHVFEIGKIKHHHPGRRSAGLVIGFGKGGFRLSSDVAVELYQLPLTDTLFVAVHADRGAADLFEFDMMDKINSPDQPFFVDGTEVALAINVR